MQTIEDYNDALSYNRELRSGINRIIEDIRVEHEKIEDLMGKRDEWAADLVRSAQTDKVKSFTSKVASFREYVRTDYELLQEEYPEFSYPELLYVFTDGIYAVSRFSSEYLMIHWTDASTYRNYSDIEAVVTRNQELKERKTLIPVAWFFDKVAFQNSFTEKVSAKRDRKEAAKLKDQLEKSAKRSVRRAGGEQFELDTLGGEGTTIDVIKFLKIRSGIDDRKIGAFAYPYVAVESLLVLAQANSKTVTHENVMALLVDPLIDKVASLSTPHEIAINRVHIDTFKEILASC